MCECNVVARHSKQTRLDRSKALTELNHRLNSCRFFLVVFTHKQNLKCKWPPFWNETISKQNLRKLGLFFQCKFFNCFYLGFSTNLSIHRLDFLPSCSCVNAVVFTRFLDSKKLAKYRWLLTKIIEKLWFIVIFASITNSNFFLLSWNFVFRGISRKSND